ncbi:MAG TPA: hypothetical protein VGI57_06175 [Usitatibacter sp.]|jgi:hypothetical protein
MKNLQSTIVTALALAVATLVHGQDPAAMLSECMKLLPGSPQQNSCIATAKVAADARTAAMKAQAAASQAAANAAAVQAAQAQAAQAAAAAKAAQSAAAAKAAQSTAAAKTPAASLKAAEVPPDVKQAAQQLGLAGAPATSLSTGASKAPAADISNMQLQAALAMMQSQQAALTDAHMKQQLSTAQDRAAQMAAVQDAANRMKEAAQKQLNASIAQGAMSLGSGLAGLNTLKSMKSAGLDTSMVKQGMVNGAASYSISKAQADAYNEQLKAKMMQAQTDQTKQAEQIQAAAARNKQALETMLNYMAQMQQQQVQIIGNMH